MSRKVKFTAGLSTSLFVLMTGWAAMPSKAFAYAYGVYGNDYRVCAAQLLGAGVPTQNLSQACAEALRPQDLSSCVVSIHKKTELAVLDALSSCQQARRPKELATCVVGISRNAKEPANTAVLNYCGRSLIPINFARCVIGLRLEVDIPPSQAMDTCIDTSSRVTGVLPSFIPGYTPAIQPFPPISQPNFQQTSPSNQTTPQITPVPGTPNVPQTPNSNSQFQNY